MVEGFAAAIAAAGVWAVSSAVIAHQGRSIDPFSISLLRAIWAGIFLIGAVFVLGAEGDFGRMSAGDLAQLIGAGFISTAVAETLYAFTIPLFGFTRTYTTTTAAAVLFAYVFGFLFIGDTLTVLVGVGSVVVLAGVYIVAIYGKSRRHVGGVEEAARVEPAVALPGALLPYAFGVGLVLAVVTGMAWGGVSVWLRSAAEGFDAAAAGVVRMPVVLPALALLRSAAEGFDAAAAGVVRMPVVLPALALLAGVQSRSSLRRRAISRRSFVWLALSGALGTGLVILLIITALQRIGAGEFTVLFNTGPVFGIVLGAIFLRERVTPWAVIGALLVLGGIAMIAMR